MLKKKKRNQYKKEWRNNRKGNHKTNIKKI